MRGPKQLALQITLVLLIASGCGFGDDIARDGPIVAREVPVPPHVELPRPPGAPRVPGLPPIQVPEAPIGGQVVDDLGDILDELNNLSKSADEIEYAGGIDLIAEKLRTKIGDEDAEQICGWWRTYRTYSVDDVQDASVNTIRSSRARGLVIKLLELTRHSEFSPDLFPDIMNTACKTL